MARLKLEKLWLNAMDGERFPMAPKDKRRILLLSTEDEAKFNGLSRGNEHERVVVYDHAKKERLAIARLSCGLNCFCAAQGFTIPQ